VQEFFGQNALYVVLAVVLVIWAGILGYLYRVEKKIKKLEQQIGKP
jgi:CcmD family protein